MQDANQNQKINSKYDLSELIVCSVLYGLVFAISGCVYSITSYFLRGIQANLLLNLLPGYWPTTDSAVFKRELVAFILIQLTLIFGTFVLIVLGGRKQYFHKFCSSRKMIALFLVASIAATIYLRDGILRIYPLICSIFFLVALLGGFALNLNYDAKYQRYLANGYRFIYRVFNIVVSHKVKILITLLLFSSVVIPGYRAWYPLVLPNDYYEIPNIFKNTVLIQGGPTLSFEQTQKFLEKNKLETTHPQGYGELLSAFDGLNGWTAETGRTFYHHAYIFVPAIHWLKYGFDNSIPYLYGYGNTIFSASLMSIGGASLSSYFYFYPITLLLGLLGICAFAAYCGGSKKIFLVAIFLGLYELYDISFTAALLAASFNPIRYIGISLQLATAFFYFRSSSPFRYLSLIVATSFSFFWNAEFAFIGAISQVLALLLDKHPRAMVPRLATFFGLLFLPVVYRLFSNPSVDILNSIYLGFFQVNMPFLSGKQGVSFILMTLVLQLVLVLLCLKFRGAERMARLSILPSLMLVLIKVIYNPSSPHLDITLLFLIPFLLVYIPRDKNYFLYKNIPNSLKNLSFPILILSLALLCWNKGIKYEEESNFIRRYYVMPFQASPWTSLGETIPMVTRGDEVANRVRAINNKLGPDDALLILSPLDHLISFYVNPKKYCGHFELISNLTQKSDFEKIKNCVNNAKNILIVYDQALSTPCPDLKKLNMVNRCSQKLEVKNNVIDVLKYLPKLKESGREGNLIFYRKDLDSL